VIDRRTFIATSAMAILAAPLAAEAQQASKVHRIGVLSHDGAPPGLLEAFLEGLHELGYVEGKNITIELRNAAGKNERLSALADELLRLKVDIILAVNTPAAQAAKKATATIPIVITRIGDPVKSGLVPSLARPGGNVTGLSVNTPELAPKRIQLLREALPGISRVAALFHADNPGAILNMEEAGRASSKLGLQFLRLPVRGPSDFPGAFQAATRARAEALVVIDDGAVTQHRGQILTLAMNHSLPVVSIYKDFAQAGGLIAYGPSLPALYRRAAYYVDRILKGAKPSDLPIEEPTRFELVINLKTAKALGLTIPRSLLMRADQVIQ
jgi:putative ABC transport system substrate-binding protein